MIVFDGVMMAGLVEASIQPLKWSRPAGAIGAWVVLPIIGLLAGLGLFVLRLSGGLPAEYSPRAGQARTASSAYPPDLEEFGKRAGAAMSFYQAEDSPWQKELLASAIATLRLRFAERRHANGMICRLSPSAKETETYAPPHLFR